MADPSPGPWEFTGPAEPGWQESPDFEFFEVHGSDGDLVALAAGEGNARLIVAQSDLLAALKAVAAKAFTDDSSQDNILHGGEPLAAECSFCGWDREIHEVDPNPDCPMPQVLAAIAKAEGI